MNIVCIQVYFEQPTNPSWDKNLVECGWTKESTNLFSRKLNKFLLKFQIKFNQKVLYVMKKFVKYIKMPTFELQEIWDKLWSKDIVPKKIELYCVDDYSEQLLQLGWKQEGEKYVSPDGLVVFEKFRDEKTYFYRFTDFSPVNTKMYLKRIEELGL